MRKWFYGLLVCLAGGFASLATGQDWAAQEQAAPPPPAADQAAEGEWIPDGVAMLGRGASSRVEFRLDHSMLALASKIDSSNPEFRRAIAGLNGISFRTFRFAEGVWPDPATMEVIARQYQEAGWMRVMSKHGYDGGSTDLWIRAEALAIRQVAVLLVRSRQVEFIAASGVMSPLELLHLSGHFGIPKMDQPPLPPPPSAKAREFPNQQR